MSLLQRGVGIALMAAGVLAGLMAVALYLFSPIPGALPGIGLPAALVWYLGVLLARNASTGLGPHRRGASLAGVRSWAYGHQPELSGSRRAGGR